MVKEELKYVRVGDTVVSADARLLCVLKICEDHYVCAPCESLSPQVLLKFHSVVGYVYHDEYGKPLSRAARENPEGDVIVPVRLRKCWVQSRPDTRTASGVIFGGGWHETWNIVGTDRYAGGANIPACGSIVLHNLPADQVTYQNPKDYREMTVAEIEKLVGCKVKIVKEKT